MRVERKKRRFLALQRLQAVKQRDMLGNVGEVASMINMAIVHGWGEACPNCIARHRNTSPMTIKITAAAMRIALIGRRPANALPKNITGTFAIIMPVVDPATTAPKFAYA